MRTSYLLRRANILEVGFFIYHLKFCSFGSLCLFLYSGDSLCFCVWRSLFILEELFHFLPVNVSHGCLMIFSGDVEHTHLVKGLDYALLNKVRSEIVKKPDAGEENDGKSKYVLDF